MLFCWKPTTQNENSFWTWITNCFSSAAVLLNNEKKICFPRFYKIVWQHKSVDFYIWLSLLPSSFAFLVPLFSSLLGRFFGSTMFFGLFFQASLTESCSLWNSFKDIFWSWCLHGAFTHKTCIQRTIIIWVLLNNLFSLWELNKQAYSWFSHYVTKIKTKKLSHL